MPHKPRRLGVFLARVRGLEAMSLEEAKDKAKEIAKIVAIVGVARIVIFGIGAIILTVLE